MDVRVPWENPSFGEREIEHLRRALQQDGASMIDDFEAALGEFIGNPRVVTVSNGTLALLVALMLVDVGAGDKVIAPTYTFAAVVNPILLLGATTVLVDSDPGSINMDLDALEEKLQEDGEVKAVFHVDVGGVPPDHERLRELSNRYGFAVIEDGAEALGSEYAGRRVGALPHIVTLSFQAAKQLTSGEGGAVVLPNDDLYERCRLLRHHGMSAQYEHTAFGLNFRLPALNAAVGLAQMERLDGFLAHRNAVMDMYRAGLGRRLRFQSAPSGMTKVSWGMALARAESQGLRDRIRTALAEAGVETRVNWKPVHQQPYHSKLMGGEFPVADRVFDTGFTLPLNNSMSLDDAAFVVETARSGLA